MSSRIVVIAAGSGGHILPALVFARQWCSKALGRVISFVGSYKKLDGVVLQQKDSIDTYQQYYLINLPGLKIWRYPMFFFQLIRIFIQAFFLLRRQKPELVYSTGALLAVPFCLAARLQRIPVTLHELNARPGKAILFLAPFVTEILITFESSRAFFKHHAFKCQLAEYPIRFTHQDQQISSVDALQQLCSFSEVQLVTTKKTMMVVGGSQGSFFLNQTIIEWLTSLSKEERSKIQLLHQAGAVQVAFLQKQYQELGVTAFVFAYFHQLQIMYQASDLVICRAGAGTLFELLFFKKQAIIIPLEGQADDHQLANAQELAVKNPNLFTVIQQAEIGGKLSIVLHKELST